MANEEGVASKSLAALADFDDLLISIFKILPMKELQKCSKVCKKWHELSSIVQKSRHSIGWFMFSPQLHSHELHPQIADKLQLLSSAPKQCLLFMTNSLFEDHVAVPDDRSSNSERAMHPRAAKLEKMVFSDYLLRLLPTSCQLIGIAADGNVGTDWELKECLEAENAVSASGIFFPELSGVTVRRFSATLSELSQKLFDSSIDPDELRSITCIPETEQPKLILLFMSEHVNDLAIPTLLVLQHRSVVVAGGLVDGILPTQETENPMDSDEFLLGLSFCGGDNLRVASVIVPAEINTETGVTLLLKKLQNTHVCDGARQSLAFMFACIGRGQYHFRGKRNVEASAFHRLFPTVPLFGFFGNGEIGCNYLPDYSSGGGSSVCLVEEESGEERVPGLQHAYTTIFVIMSIL